MPADTKVLYGLNWPALMLPLLIEQEMIKRGGRWKTKSGKEVGNGLPFHYAAFMAQLWPEEDQHRWFTLILTEWCQNIMTTMMGSKDSSKTRTMAVISLADYYVFPYNTLGICSSTSGQGIELRIWGDIKSLHLRAKARFDFLPGQPIDSLGAITTDNLKEDQLRDMRRGLICISGEKLGNFVGIKQGRRRLYADEVQFMKTPFLDALANLNSGDFKGMFSGNPMGDGDPLDKIAEPKEGWSSIPEPEKTTVWNTRDIGGRCVNLIGTDSPNFDQSQEPEPKYPYMIHQKSIDRVVARFGMNSIQYFSQCKGIRMTGMDAMKVLTRDMCVEFHALEQVFWRNETRTKVYAVDAAYGNIGGDRCVGGWIEFGRDVTDKVILSCTPPVIIPIKPHKMAGRSPEDQIALYVRDACEKESIPPGHVFYDATGRGSLGTSFARAWSADVNPVEFGGAPSDRPITSELTILDHKTGQFRLMTAKEHFSKFVSELWFVVRYVVESGQMRNLPEEVMMEGCRRIWRMVRGDKVEIETKPEMKERTGESPDLFDWLCFDENTYVLTPNGEVPISEIKPGQLVSTPHGPVIVESCMKREASHLAEVELSNGRSLIGTASHKIFTWDSGWTRLDSLVLASELESCHDLPLWHPLNTLFTTDENIGFKATVDIIRAQTKLTRKGFFIESFGLTTWGLFQKACVSIIKTAIGRIVAFPISNCLLQALTCVCTFWRGLKIRITERKTATTCGQFGATRLNGTAAPPGNGGTQKTAGINGSKKSGRQRDASYADGNFSASGQKGRASALSDAGEGRRGHGSATLLAYARCVLSNLSRTGTVRQNIAPVTVRRLPSHESRLVYNLSLERHHAYYANGVLVANCTAVEGARRLGFTIARMEVVQEGNPLSEWKKRLKERQSGLRSRHQLTYSQ